MRLGIKGKQVLGVTSLVSVVVVVLSVLHLARLASVGLNESRARAEMLANAIFHRAREVVRDDGDPYQALRADPGLRSVLESSLYSKNVISAAIVDAKGYSVADADPLREGQLVTAGADLDGLLAKAALAKLAAIYSGQGRNFDFRQPLLIGDREFGSIRIEVSTLLIREDLDASLRPAVAAATAAFAVAVIVATVLAQLMLRPIHVIRSGLTRLGRGEFGVQLKLDQDDEFGELGTFFNAVSEQLSVDRTQMAGQVANLESAVDRLEDAVAIVNAGGDLLFANPAMRALVPELAAEQAARRLPADQPLHRLADETLVSRRSRGPLQISFGEAGERVVSAHVINDTHGALVGIMLTARNVEYLDQVQSTLRYSRKLAALGRLSAGVAHEVKNPLNAMMIHLELLRQQFVVAPSRRPGAPQTSQAVATVDGPPTAALQHVDTIANEIRRLDQVLQGFLKFARPEDLKLQPIRLSGLVNEVIPVIRSEADQAGVTLVVECDNAPPVNGDAAMFHQAFLNLALNACQAMPHGGTLRIRCERYHGQRVSITFADTGVGIAPEHLKRIFDLYFTTKEKGSGIGLSMVFRTVQMHDGEIEVQSTPGKGTTFQILLPQA